MPARDLAALRWPDEAPTKPETPSVLMRAHRRRQRSAALYIAVGALAGALVLLFLYWLVAP